MYSMWEFWEEILLRGENVKPEKNQISGKKGKMVNCQNSAGRKPENFLDLG